MANTYTQIYIQLVFAVKNRESLIKEDFREELEKYMCGIINGQGQKPLAIYCMPDHTHILVGMKPNLTISDLVKEIKVSSGAFIKDKQFLPFKFQWQEGYGAFSYSKSNLDNVINYILNQQEHHKHKTFKDEYFDFLKKFEIEYDEKYVFEWLE